MREWAMDKRKKQAQEFGQAPASPEYGEPPPASHYGKSPAAPASSVPPKETPSFENQSIYPSIKESCTIAGQPHGHTNRSATLALTTVPGSNAPLITSGLWSWSGWSSKTCKE